MTSNRTGAQSGLICSWMWDAVETVACLACVCVTEVLRDGGGEGTSGPQLVCHSLNLLPAAITADRLGHDHRLIISRRLKSRLRTLLVCRYPDTVSASLCIWGKVVSLFLSLPYSMLSCPLNLNSWQAIQIWRNCSFPHSSHSVCVPYPFLQPSGSSYVCVYSTWLTCFRRAGCKQQSHHFTSSLSDQHHRQEDCTSARNTQILASQIGHTMSTFVPSLSSSVWPVVCVDSTCTYLLVYLLQESGLPAEEQSHNVSLVRGKAGWETETWGHCLSGRHVFVIPSMVHQSEKTLRCLFFHFFAGHGIRPFLEKKW